MNRLKHLQWVTRDFATELGHEFGLFGMTLNEVSWKDGASYDDGYNPRKSLNDFTEEDCLLTIRHILEWWEDERYREKRDSR